MKQVTQQEAPDIKGPEKKFRAGAISVSIWKNAGTGQNGEATEFYTVSFERRYKDKTDQWQSSHSLRLNDLPKAQLVLAKAYEYMALAEADA